MALTKIQKQAQVKSLRESLKKAKSLVFMHYLGMTVSQVDELRAKMGEKNAKMQVAKKRLFNIAAKEEGYPEVDERYMDGPVAFIFSFEDEMSGAKIAYEFGKTVQSVEIIGGVLNGKVLNKHGALELAKMLSHEELLSKFAMMLRAPLTGFASACGSPLSAFARAIKQISEKGGAHSELSS